jgi:hypothetical protein
MNTDTHPIDDLSVFHHRSGLARTMTAHGKPKNVIAPIGAVIRAGSV